MKKCKKYIIFDKSGKDFNISFFDNISFKSFKNAYENLGIGVDCEKEFERLTGKKIEIEENGTIDSIQPEIKQPKPSENRKKGNRSKSRNNN